MENRETIEEQMVENTEDSFVDSIAEFISNNHGINEMNKTYDIDEAAKKGDVYDASGKGDFDTTGKGTEGEQEAEDEISVSDQKKNKKTIEPKSSAASKSQTEEHLSALFDGEELSEEFMSKASTIFEAAINERVTVIENEIIEHYTEQLTLQVESAVSDLSEKLDDYLGYVVDEWVKENELAIERGIKADVTENFINGLKELFENCYIDIPNEKYDLLDGLFESNEVMENNLNEEIQKNIELRKELISHRCGEVFVEEASGLADTEIERFASLADGIDFEDENQYRDKLKILKESYFNSAVDETYTDEVGEGTGTGNPTELIVEEGTPMDRYVNTLSRQLKN